MEIPTRTDISPYLEVDSTFFDFVEFEDDNAVRRAQRQAFIDNKVWAPEYRYPKLDTFYDDRELEDGHVSIVDRKRDIYEAVLQLEAARASGEYNDAELELWAGCHELGLKRMMLVEAARRLHDSPHSAAQDVARVEFMHLNREIYGEYDVSRFTGMMATEQQNVETFEPRKEKATEVKAWLSHYFSQHDFGKEREEAIIEEALLSKLKGYIEQRYEAELSVIPDTGDTIIYDAEQSREIMQAALDIGGLSEAGWVVKVDAKKSNPTTKVDTKEIFLPETTRRTATQLRRLIIHEQEDHARRGQNGTDSSVVFLERGTADYADVEEGLGVILECALAESLDNPSYHRARDRYIVAGLALGADGIPRDARATYETAWRLIALREANDGSISSEIEQDAKNRAMAHVENAFRGTNFVSPGIIYTKLKVYFEGLAKNAEFFKEYKDNLDEAFDLAMLGKYDHTNPEERYNIQEILGRVA